MLGGCQVKAFDSSARGATTNWCRWRWRWSGTAQQNDHKVVREWNLHQQHVHCTAGIATEGIDKPQHNHETWQLSRTRNNWHSHWQGCRRIRRNWSSCSNATSATGSTAWQWRQQRSRQQQQQPLECHKRGAQEAQGGNPWQAS